MQQCGVGVFLAAVMLIALALAVSHFSDKIPLSPKYKPISVVPAMHFINLDSRPERRVRLESQLEALDMKATRVRGFHSYEVGQNTIGNTWVADLNSRFDTRQHPERVVRLSSGERGCAGSHAYIWRQNAHAQEPIVIFEDDAMLQPGFKERLMKAIGFINHLNDIVPPILYLEHLVAKWGHQRYKLDSDFEVREVQYAWNLSGYVVWPQTIRVLLENMPMNEPVDNYIARLYYDGKLKAYACNPMIVKQFCTQCDGDILHTLLE